MDDIEMTERVSFRMPRKPASGVQAQGPRLFNNPALTQELTQELELMAGVEYGSAVLAPTPRSKIEQVATSDPLPEQSVEQLPPPVQLGSAPVTIAPGKKHRKRDRLQPSVRKKRKRAAALLGPQLPTSLQRKRYANRKPPKWFLQSLQYLFAGPEPAANEDEVKYGPGCKYFSSMFDHTPSLTSATSFELPLRPTKITSFNLPIRNFRGQSLHL